MKKLALLAVLIAVPSLARADAPGLRFDESETQFDIVNTYDTKDGIQFNPGWALRVQYRLTSTEPMQPSSTLRFTVKQKGKVQGELACSVTPNGDKIVASDTCYDNKQQLKLIGDVDVDVVYVDGASDAQTPLRSFKLKVLTSTQVRGNGAPAASQQYVSWHGRVLDNVIIQIPKWSSSTSAMVHLWVRYAPDYEATIPSVMDTAFFCTVDGTLLPTPDRADIFRSLRSTTEQVVPRTVQDGTSYKNEYRKVTGVQLQLPMTFAAEPDAASGKGGKGGAAPADPGLWVLEDHPGKWECKWKYQGKALRTFRFTVAGGKIQPHPEQLAGLYLGEGVTLVETVIPADSVLDGSIAADEVKASGFFGRPWATPEGKAMAAAVPKKGTPHYPQPKALDFGKPIKKWEFTKGK